MLARRFCVNAPFSSSTIFGRCFRSRSARHVVNSTDTSWVFKNRDTILKLNTNTILTSNQLAFHPFSNSDSWNKCWFVFYFFLGALWFPLFLDGIDNICVQPFCPAIVMLVLRAELHVFIYFSLVQWRYLSWYSLDVPFSPLFQGPPGRPGFPVTVFCHFGCI